MSQRFVARIGTVWIEHARLSDRSDRYFIVQPRVQYTDGAPQQLESIGPLTKDELLSLLRQFAVSVGAQPLAAAS